MIKRDKIKILILAAGKGVRMKSDKPKALMEVADRSMIEHLLLSIEKSGIDDRPVVVVGYGKEKIMSALGPNYDYVIQKEQLGTGHAVSSAYEFLKNKAENILVLPSDHPFITSETLKELTQAHLDSGSTLTMTTTTLPDFKKWRAFFYTNFSRIIRNKNGEIVKDVQFKDASEEEKKITEVNPIYFCFEAKWLWKKIKTLKTDNAQKEYYLTDLVKIAIEDGIKIKSISIDPREALAANSKEELEMLEKIMIQSNP
ncbi:MAG: NTP transferase domain-containing protein [Patescibacteria group bacterium]